MPRPGPRPFRPHIVRWTLAGKRCPAGTPGAVREVTRLDTWYCKVGKQRVSLRTVDEGQAWERLRELLRRRAEGRAGLRDSYTEAAERPLAEHLDDYAAVLVAKGDGDGQVSSVRVDVLRVAREAGWTSIADITADSCLLALGRIVARLNLAPRTRNGILAHCKQFARWLSRPTVGRLRLNPLDSPDLGKLSEDTDRRHDRRPPTEAEIVSLMTYLHSPKARRRRGMDGPTRALGYRVCMATGFRAGELRSLTPANFDLEKGTVTVTGAYSKNRRKDVQPLPAWLVVELRAFFAAGGVGWNFPAKSPGRILYPDLTAAGIPISLPSPSGPLFLDFHSLRHYYVSSLANSPGVSPNVLQKLARHSDPRLSLAVYAHARTEELRRAVEAIPPPGQPQPAPPAEPPAVCPEPAPLRPNQPHAAPKYRSGQGGKGKRKGKGVDDRKP